MFIPDFLHELNDFDHKYPFIIPEVETGKRKKYSLQIKEGGNKYSVIGHIILVGSNSILFRTEKKEFKKILFEDIISIAPIILEMFSLIREDNEKT